MRPPSWVLCGQVHLVARSRPIVVLKCMLGVVGLFLFCMHGGKVPPLRTRSLLLSTLKPELFLHRQESKALVANVLVNNSKHRAPTKKASRSRGEGPSCRGHHSNEILATDRTRLPEVSRLGRARVHCRCRGFVLVRSEYRTCGSAVTSPIPQRYTEMTQVGCQIGPTHINPITTTSDAHATTHQRVERLPSRVARPCLCWNCGVLPSLN